MEGAGRQRGVARVQAGEQLALGQHQRVHHARRAQPHRAGAEVVALGTRPEAKVEDDIGAKRERPRGHAPHQRLDGGVARVVRGVGQVVAEQRDMPLVGREAQGAVLLLKLAGERGFAGAGQADDQVECGHGDLQFCVLRVEY